MPGQAKINPIDGAKMVWIRGGEFFMGTDPDEVNHMWAKFQWREDGKTYAREECPRHKLAVSGFWMYTCEVTNDQFRKFVEANPCWAIGGSEARRCDAVGSYLGHWTHGDEDQEMPAGEHYPVVNISWCAALAYAEWAGVRLPTEAEWEYAARGGRSSTFPWGDRWPPPDQSGNFADETAFKHSTVEQIVYKGYDDGFPRTSPVGQFKPNPFGLYDMAGNVWEWCSTEYRDYPYSAADGRESLDGYPFRVMRGSSWRSPADSLYCACRTRSAPEICEESQGFRCAASP